MLGQKIVGCSIPYANPKKSDGKARATGESRAVCGFGSQEDAGGEQRRGADSGAGLGERSRRSVGGGVEGIGVLQAELELLVFLWFHFWGHIYLGGLFI